MHDVGLAHAERKVVGLGSLCLLLMAVICVLGGCLSLSGMHTLQPYWALMPALIGFWVGNLGILWRAESSLVSALSGRLAFLHTLDGPRIRAMQELSEVKDRARLQWVLACMLLVAPLVAQAGLSLAIPASIPLHLLVFGFCLGGAAWLGRGPAWLRGLDAWLSALEQGAAPIRSRLQASLAPLSLKVWSATGILLAIALAVFAGSQALDAVQRTLRGGLSGLSLLRLSALAAIGPWGAVLLLLPAWARRAQRCRQELWQAGRAVLAVARGEHDRSAPRPDVERLVLLGRLVAIACTLGAALPVVLGIVGGVAARNNPGSADLLPFVLLAPMAGGLFALGQFCRLRALRWQAWVGLQDTLLQKLEMGDWRPPSAVVAEEEAPEEQERLNPDPPPAR